MGSADVVFSSAHVGCVTMCLGTWQQQEGGSRFQSVLWGESHSNIKHLDATCTNHLYINQEKSHSY